MTFISALDPMNRPDTSGAEDEPTRTHAGLLEARIGDWWLPLHDS